MIRIILMLLLITTISLTGQIVNRRLIKDNKNASDNLTGLRDLCRILKNKQAVLNHQPVRFMKSFIKIW